MRIAVIGRALTFVCYWIIIIQPVQISTWNFSCYQHHTRPRRANFTVLHFLNALISQFHWTRVLWLWQVSGETVICVCTAIGLMSLRVRVHLRSFAVWRNAVKCIRHGLCSYCLMRYTVLCCYLLLLFVTAADSGCWRTSRHNSRVGSVGIETTLRAVESRNCGSTPAGYKDIWSFSETSRSAFVPTKSSI